MTTTDKTEPLAPRIEGRTEKEVIASWREILFEIWLARGSAADIRAGIEVVKKYLARVPGPMIGFSIVHPPAMGPLDSDGRAAIAEQARVVNPRSKAGALVILSGGFSGAIVRSIATGLSLISPPKHPNKVFDTMERACAWIAPHVTPVDGRAVTPEEIMAAYRQLPTPPDSR